MGKGHRQYLTFWVSSPDTQMWYEGSAYTITWYTEIAVYLLTNSSLLRQRLFWHLPPQVGQAQVKCDASGVFRAKSCVFNN